MPKLTVTPANQLPPPQLPVRQLPGAGRTAAASRSPQSASPADPAKLAKAASDFEALAIGQLLQPMFDTVNTAKGAFGGGPGEEAWKPMMVQEFAKQMTAHGGLGLAKPIYDAMLRIQEANKK
jgi:Rod binding domain-containing protein